MIQGEEMQYREQLSVLGVFSLENIWIGENVREIYKSFLLFFSNLRTRGHQMKVLEAPW